MKNIIQRILSVVTVILLQYVTSYGQAPDVSWSVEHWPPSHPVNGTQDQNESGEDWYYDHKLSLDENGKPNGYIAAGYCAFINWSPEGSNDCFKANAKYWDTSADWDPNECRYFYDSTYLRGTIVSCMALTDLCGNLQWFKPTYMAEEFWKVIQTSDGNYVAVGRTPSSHYYDPSNQTYYPVYYNPAAGHTTDQFNSSPLGNCNDGENNRKMYVVKMDRNGNILWQYLYGMVDYTSDGSAAYDNSTDGWDIVETDNGSLMAVGYSQTPSNPRKTFVIEINSSNGYVIWKNTYGEENDMHSRGYVIAKSEDGYIIGGVHSSGISYDGKAYLMAIDKTSSHDIIWGDPESSMTVQYYGNSTQDNNITDIDINANNEVLVPVLTDLSGSSANGRLYKIASDDGSTIGGTYQSLGSFKAYDRKIGVTPTSDGGYAIVSTKQPGGVPSCPNPPHSTVTSDCGVDYDLDYWGTDAYVAKYSSAGSLEWSKTWDSNSDRPAGSACSWTYPDPNRLDVKMQECMYSIVESPTGGFVVGGNTSSNFDDCYLSALEGSCSSLSLSGLTITTDQEYFCQTITASTVSVSNPGDVDFIAQNSITLNPGFYASTNKKFVALIASHPSCSSSPKIGVWGNLGGMDNYIYEQDSKNVKIYPNPSTGSVKVDLSYDEDKNVTIFVLSPLGDEIYKKEMGSVKAATEQIELGSYYPGIYIIKVKSNNTVTSQKVTIFK